jgi:predicted nucleic acid-binding protein
MPAGDGPVVADTTPLIALSLVDRLGLLRSLYHRVVIPPAVRSELEAGGSRGSGSVDLAAASWIETVPLEDPSRADLLADLDRGEAEVIALGQERHARLVIIDERLGRQHARRLGLPLTGTIGVLLRAKEKGLLPAIRPSLEILREGGIYLGAELVERALRLAGE